MSKLAYTLCRDQHGKPLVTLDSPLWNGQEIYPVDLRVLGQSLMNLADLAEKKDMGAAYRPEHGKCHVTLQGLEDAAARLWAERMDCNIAVTDSGFVDGACFTESEDSGKCK